MGEQYQESEAEWKARIAAEAAYFKRLREHWFLMESLSGREAVLLAHKINPDLWETVLSLINGGLDDLEMFRLLHKNEPHLWRPAHNDIPIPEVVLSEIKPRLTTIKDLIVRATRSIDPGTKTNERPPALWISWFHTQRIDMWSDWREFVINETIKAQPAIKMELASLSAQDIDIYLRKLSWTLHEAIPVLHGCVPNGHAVELDWGRFPVAFTLAWSAAEIGEFGDAKSRGEYDTYIASPQKWSAFFHSTFDLLPALTFCVVGQPEVANSRRPVLPLSPPQSSNADNAENGELASFIESVLGRLEGVGKPKAKIRAIMSELKSSIGEAGSPIIKATGVTAVTWRSSYGNESTIVKKRVSNLASEIRRKGKANKSVD